MSTLCREPGGQEVAFRKQTRRNTSFYFFASVRGRWAVIPLKWILTMLFGNRSADLAKSDPDDDLYEDFNYRCVVSRSSFVRARGTAVVTLRRSKLEQKW